MLPIKFVLRIIAVLALAGHLSSLLAQTNSTSASDPTGQSQPQAPAQAPGQGSTQAPAQDQTAPQAQQAPDKSKEDQGTSDPGTSDPGTGSQGKVKGTSNDRLFYTLPNFLTMEKGAKLPPLTTKEKFKVVALGTFDPIEFPWWGAIAAVSQSDNSEPGYGQGWVGYAKRYGATAGDSTIENFMVGAVFPSILHQDPRFYYSSNGRFLKRTGYAISRIFVTRGDSGKTEFNFSEIFGAAVAAGISTNTYHPRGTYISRASNPHLFVASDRTLSNTASVWATQVGLDSITIVIKEFWPDVHRALKSKYGKDKAAAAPGE